MKTNLAHFKNRQPDMLRLLAELVRRESFTREKASVDRLVSFIHTQLSSLGASSLQRYPQMEVGDFLLAKWNEGAAGKPYLFLMHLDTVHPTGSLETMPIQD